MSVLKQFGLGILWAILLPLLLVIVALIAVFGIFNFVVQFFIMIVNFFRGKKLFPPLPEDEKAYAILKKAYAEDAQASATEQAKQPSQIYIQQNFYQSAPKTDPATNPYLNTPETAQIQNNTQNPVGITQNPEIQEAPAPKPKNPYSIYDEEDPE